MPERIIAVNKDPDGNIVAVKTSSGNVLSVEQAVDEVQKGNLAGVQVVNREGKRYLRSYPDSERENNLDNMPKI